MGRPKKISDGELLAACERAIGRHGPGFTLAQVADVAGVSVGTVAGRFGSKHGLLLALMAGGTAALEARMRSIIAAQPDPVAAVRESLVLAAVGVDDPETAAQHLAQLGADLADPGLREGFAAQRRAVRSVLTPLLEEAGLPYAPPARQAAGILAALVNGLQQDWALSPEGALADRLRQDLDSVMSAWRGPRSAL
ncbi:TetR family transcriptional regulator [Streptomyces albus subsp. chlorinus]|uniref:Transcriptional regulator BetI n=1 Tax=Streptomyces albus subsp. chlorinus TaxID=337066 RepID=A0A386KS48_9ACTN|nr:TetR/AcrR family transcriptional regulator [Streptomyces albus]AYD88537.1 transcriptional regulator BetI [Streptomyces albus subsp. chlorinus]NSC25511.1 TetR family transcriptional regulator [Streptomyces albus subsp. chlorinus]